MYKFTALYSSVVTILMLLSSPVHANAAPIANSGKYYAGIGLGHMKLENKYTDEYFQTNPMLFQAGYRYSPYISIEARYVRNIGKVMYENGTTLSSDDNNFPTTFSNAAAYLKPQFSYGAYSFYALCGYGEVKLTNIRGADRIERGFQWGAGLSYKASDKLSVFADYTKVYSGDGFDGRAKARTIHVDLMAIGVSYEF